MAWAGFESGWRTPCDGVHGAHFNVWNTTLFVPGCTAARPYNSVPVQNYNSALCGAEAVADTLLHTPNRGYDAIIAELSRPFNSGRNVLHAVADSDWGSFKLPGGGPDYAEADAIWRTYKKSLRDYNAVLVGP